MRARDNPFASDRVLRIRYALPDDDWPGLIARLARLGDRAAIVGPRGSGKTTLLEDLEERLRASGVPTLWLRRDASQPAFARAELDACFADVTPRTIICFDGAEQLTRLAWRSFERRARRARGLVITSHRPGLLPTLHTCTTDVDLLANIVSRLVPEPPRRPPSFLPTVDDLFFRHRGNVRDALRELYDWYAMMP
jgi:hypothetical protein